MYSSSVTSPPQCQSQAVVYVCSKNIFPSLNCIKSLIFKVFIDLPQKKCVDLKNSNSDDIRMNSKSLKDSNLQEANMSILNDAASQAKNYCLSQESVDKVIPSSLITQQTLTLK